MNGPTPQRTALVTGGAVRVGRVLSLGLAGTGYDLVVHYGRSATEAASLGAEVEAMGRRCTLVQADLATVEGIESVAAACPPALDLVVNNAATFRSAPLDDVDAEEWARALDVNARAPHLLVRALAPALRAGGGSVVNIVDLSAFQAWTEHPHHAVSKAALAHLTRVQARAYAPEIRVNAVAPGAVLPPDDYPPARLEALRARTPLGTLGRPEDVLQAVLYLAEARFVTGQILAVDGGRLLGPSGPPGG